MKLCHAAEALYDRIIRAFLRETGSDKPRRKSLSMAPGPTALRGVSR